MAMILEGQILFIGTPDELSRAPDERIQHFLHAELPRLNHNSQA
jgi:hypothetical protein